MGWVWKAPHLGHGDGEMDMPKSPLKTRALQGQLNSTAPKQLFKEMVLTFKTQMRLLGELLMEAISIDSNFKEQEMKKMLAQTAGR